VVDFGLGLFKFLTKKGNELNNANVIVYFNEKKMCFYNTTIKINFFD